MNFLTAQTWFLKVGVLGDFSVGKTDFCCTLLQKDLSQEYFHHVGMFLVPYKVEREIKGVPHTIRLDLWFLSGKETFATVRSTILKNCDFLILIFNQCKRSSFENIINWVNDIKNVFNNIPLFIVKNVATKCDETEKVKEDEIKEMKAKVEKMLEYAEVLTADLTNKDEVKNLLENIVDTFIKIRFKELAKLL